MCQLVQLRLGHFALLFGDFVLPVGARVRMIVVDGRRFLFGQDVDSTAPIAPVAIGVVFVIVRLHQAGNPQVQGGFGRTATAVCRVAIGRTRREMARFLWNLWGNLALGGRRRRLRSGRVLLVGQQVFHLFRLNRAEIRRTGAGHTVQVAGERPFMLEVEERWRGEDRWGVGK